MDRLGKFWGSLAHRVLNPLGRIFDCFRRRRCEPQPAPMENLGYFSSEHCITPLAVEVRGDDGFAEDLETGHLQCNHASQQEVFNLVKQAEYLKSCGTIFKIPPELMTESENSRSLSKTGITDLEDNRSSGVLFNYQSRGSSDQLSDNAAHFPVELYCRELLEMPRKEETVSQLNDKPNQQTASSSGNHIVEENPFEVRTVSSIQDCSADFVDLPDKAAELVEFLKEDNPPSPIEGSRSSLPVHVTSWSTRKKPEQHGIRRESQSRPVRFDYEASPSSDQSVDSYSSREGKEHGSVEKSNRDELLPGRGHSPYTTPLVLSKDMQTPATVYASAKMQHRCAAGKNAKVRSQYVYPIEDLAQWSSLKEARLGVHV